MDEIRQNEARRRAERRVNELSGFYSHLLTYILVNTGLFLLNYFSSPEGHWWFIYPMFGWGIGLVCHALGVFKHGLWGSAWKERKIKELMEKES